METLVFPSPTSGFHPFRCCKHPSSAFRLPSVASSIRSSCSSIGSLDRDAKNRMFVFGMGFVGRYIADRLIREGGWEVSGTCTTANKKRELEEIGFDVSVFEATEDRVENLTSIRHATHLLVSVPPLAGIGDPLVSSHEDLRNALSDGNLKWLCYLSSTSVYGDCGGTLVTENYPANPLNNSAEARLAAERDWLNFGQQLGVSKYVFRLGGIYGPGRSALDTLLKGKVLSNHQKMRESKCFTARIHVADIYEAIKASFDVPTSGGVYNIVDDNPAPRMEVFAFAQYLIEEKWPGRMQSFSFQDALPGSANQEWRKGEKLVSNARMKAELGVNLIHPDYRSGLCSIMHLYDEKCRI